MPEHANELYKTLKYQIMDDTLQQNALCLEIDPGNLVKNQFGENYLYSLHRNTFKNIASTVLFKQTYSKDLAHEDTLFIFVGSDSGLLLQYLQQKRPEKGSTYLIIEFPEIIEKCCHDYQYEATQRVVLTTYEEWQSSANEHSLSNYLFIGKVNILESYAVKDSYISQYKLLAKKVDQELSDLKWQALITNGHQIFIQAQIDNLAENIYPASSLEKIFEGKKAILLAGGPSLDLYMDWVEEHQSNFIVIAVSRIARRLLNTNITPDFFVSIDPNDVSFDVSKELLFFSNKSILINHFHVTPLLLSQWQGLNFYVGPRYPWQTENQPRYIQPTGPTVTNAAIKVALVMGIKEIILVGVDLCYSPTGFSHASGSIEHTIGPMSSAIGQLVTTNSGQTAETENSFFNAINSLGTQAEAGTKKGCQFINPSPQAAQIKNVEYVPIDQIKIEKKSQSIREILKTLYPENPNRNKLQHQHDVVGELEDIQSVIDEVIDITKKGLDYNNLFFKDDQPEKNFQYKIEMDNIEQELDNLPSLIGPICKSYGIKEFLHFVKPVCDEEMPNDELKLWGDTYYQAYKAGAEDLQELVSKALTRLKFRIQELTKIEDVKKIADFWNHDRSPGRASIFKYTNPTAYQSLSFDEKKVINDLVLSYDNIINASFENSFQFQRITKFADLNGSEAKAFGLYSRGDHAGLKRMVNSLSEHKGDKAKPFFFYTQGLMYQLEGNIDAAIESYSKADNGPAMEQALKQILLIALDDMEFQLAENALQLLKQISPTYLPQLGKLYKIQKLYKNAVDTYTDYIEQFPEDIVQLLNLAELYQETNNMEASQFVYQHILTVDPDNIVAKTFLNQGTNDVQ